MDLDSWNRIETSIYIDVKRHRIDKLLYIYIVLAGTDWTANVRILFRLSVLNVNQKRGGWGGGEGG